jgi:translation initiation factor IF-2
LLAQKIEAWVVGFNVSFPKETEDLAKELAVSFNRYDVIYHLLEEAQNKINRMAEPDFIEEQIGKLKILAVFNHNKNGFVLGGRVIEGEVRLGLKARVLREEQVAGGGEIKNLQSNRQNVNKIQNGSECGAQFSTPDEIKVGDILEFYEKKSTH